MFSPAVVTVQMHTFFSNSIVLEKMVQVAGDRITPLRGCQRFINQVVHLLCQTFTMDTK